MRLANELFPSLPLSLPNAQETETRDPNRTYVVVVGRRPLSRRVDCWANRATRRALVSGRRAICAVEWWSRCFVCLDSALGRGSRECDVSAIDAPVGTGFDCVCYWRLIAVILS